MDKLKTENDHLIQRQAQLHDESLYHEQQYLQIETRLKEIESENIRLKSGKSPTVRHHQNQTRNGPTRTQHTRDRPIRARPGPLT